LIPVARQLHPMRGWCGCLVRPDLAGVRCDHEGRAYRPTARTRGRVLRRLKLHGSSHRSGG
jgi:hypothetical protein